MIKLRYYHYITHYVPINSISAVRLLFRGPNLLRITLPFIRAINNGFFADTLSQAQGDFHHLNYQIKLLDYHAATRTLGYGHSHSSSYRVGGKRSGCSISTLCPSLVSLVTYCVGKNVHRTYISSYTMWCMAISYVYLHKC